MQVQQRIALPSSETILLERHTDLKVASIAKGTLILASSCLSLPCLLEANVDDVVGGLVDVPVESDDLEACICIHCIHKNNRTLEELQQTLLLHAARLNIELLSNTSNAHPLKAYNRDAINLFLPLLPSSFSSHWKCVRRPTG